MKKAMVLALCYSDIFDYPLKKDELEKWQISPSVIARREVRLPDEAISIKIATPRNIFLSEKVYVARNDKIIKKGNYYCLAGREKIINLRKKREKISHEKLIEAQKVANILSKIPFIKLIAVSGTLAVSNSEKNDDIDLIIISAKNRVWLSRFFATLLLEVIGKRRRPRDINFKNKICLNMFLDEVKLTLPKIKQNLYTAHEVCQIKPIYNKDQTYEKLLEQNKWVDMYLPRALTLSLRGRFINDIGRGNLKLEDSHDPLRGSRNDVGILSFVFDKLELVAFKLQYIYMKKRITRETVEKNRILFHPRDTASIVLEEFKKRVGKKT